MKKILVVEDDRLIAELERDYLEASEYEVEMAMDGYDGLRLAKENDYGDSQEDGCRQDPRSWSGSR